MEEELSHLGKKNPSVQNGTTDWESKKPEDLEIDTADETEIADKMEEYEENTAVMSNLEVRYNEIKSALQKIADGTYGICEIGSEQIELDRLEANPAAKTCKEHMNT